MCAGLSGQLVRGGGADRGEGPIEPEPVADDHERRVGRAAQVPDDFADQLLEFRGHGLHKILRFVGADGRPVPTRHPSPSHATCWRGTRQAACFFLDSLFASYR